MELVEDRPRSLRSHPVPQGDERLVILRLALLHFALDIIEQADPGQRLMRPWRVAGPRLVELPARVHHAPDLDDRARPVQAIVGRVGVGLKITAEVLEDLLWPG